MASYDFIDQSIISSLAIQNRSNDPFFFPKSLSWTGYAFDGFLYTNGVKGVQQASWASETLNSSYRGFTSAFPTSAVVLLSATALTILDATLSPVSMWMIFLQSDTFALANNFTGADPGFNFASSRLGFTPKTLSYASGIISVGFTPDPGSSVQSSLILAIDFGQDKVFSEFNN